MLSFIFSRETSFMEFHFFGFKIAIIRFSLYRWLSQILQNKFVGYSFLVN